MYILIKYFNYGTVVYIATQTENGLGVTFFFWSVLIQKIA